MHSIFREVALLEILNRVAGLQHTGCNATKKKLLTKFPKGFLKILEIPMKSSGVMELQAYKMKSAVMELFFSNLQAYKIKSSVM